MRRHARALFAIAALGSLFAASAGTAQAAECPNEAIRIAQGATQLPDCRAFERVSPADSTGGVIGVDVKNAPLFAAMGADGDGAVFGSSSAVGATERGALKTSNLAHRTADGWTSFSVLTTVSPSVTISQSSSTWPTPSSDMSRMMFVSGESLGAPNPVSTGGSVYLSAPEGKGPPTWLSYWSLPGTQPNPPPLNAIPLGGSPDLSSGYFRYATPLTDIAGDNLRTNNYGLYHFEGETTTPAGVLPSGKVNPLGAMPAGTAIVASSGSLGVLPQLARNQVSVDGSKLFFVSPVAGSEPKQLYVEEGGAPARLVSHDTLGAPAPRGVVLLSQGVSTSYRDPGYATATADGSRVLFASADALTEDAPATGTKIYRAEITRSAITLTYLGVDRYPMAINADASTILFAVKSTTAAKADYKVWDEDRPGDPYLVASNLTSSATSAQFLEAVFSESGNVLVFQSVAEIVPGIPGGVVQIYRWTKQSEGATCIACRHDGGTYSRFAPRLSNFNGNASENPAFPNGASPEYFTQSSVVYNRKISSDGSRVFFDTSDPLDPVHDVNGVRDVYMWEDGQVHLLTSGRGDTPSLVLDNSTSGNDVMLVTKDGLVPSDTNQTYDVYDVRVDGGFAEPVKEGCEGDACQGQGSGPRQAAVPGSANLAWAGSQRESRKGKARARKAIVTSQLGRPGSSSARVRIQVPAAGKVSIAGADVKNKTRRVKRKGAVVIAVGLSVKGKHKLARKGHLKATVRVTFRPKSGAAIRKNVKLRFAGKKGGQR